jgi:hypothetical protein
LAVRVFRSHRWVKGKGKKEKLTTDELHRGDRTDEKYGRYAQTVNCKPTECEYRILNRLIRIVA